ncbi:MAG: hypoxanthine phosphoribosyltransferase [Acidobacteria bacterium]|jgi:hypoxanthine phosphoribosyltransferase|nr:hypoxanthine phosphoribosyltransferase [Acidobacteriota bacterium]MCU0253364.1 hypoxanthine phosphoribosyltransferase [Acidobacteriota bacterium]
MRRLSPEILIPAQAIRARVLELAEEICRDTPEEGEIAVLIVLKGAFVFGADLVRAIPRRIRIGFLESHKDPQKKGQADIIFTHPFPIEGADLLVVEDILDSGWTMDHMFARLRARRPERLRSVVLLDKTPRREVAVPIDYVGFQIPDVWVVGYGLDDGEAFRNLPDIRFTVES